MLVAMGAGGMTLPEALLTKLVIMALLATVAESHHALAVAVGALNWVEDCRQMEKMATPQISGSVD